MSRLGLEHAISHTLQLLEVQDSLTTLPAVFRNDCITSLHLNWTECAVIGRSHGKLGRCAAIQFTV